MNDNLSPQQFGDYTIRYAGHQDVSGNTGLHRVEAVQGDAPVGFLEWRTGGKTAGTLDHIKVEKDHRRKGIASAMWNYANESGISPAPQHSPERTTAGDAWAKSVGGKLPRKRG